MTTTTTEFINETLNQWTLYAPHPVDAYHLRLRVATQMRTYSEHAHLSGLWIEIKFDRELIFEKQLNGLSSSQQAPKFIETPQAEAG